MNGPTAATLTYVYAVTPPTPALDDVLPTLTGVAGSRVTLLAPVPDGTGPVAFAISDVPRADFEEAVLPARFEDLRWLEETARAHHRVIETLAARTTVLPLRMATLYEDRTRAMRALQSQSQEFATQLARLAAHTEYGVKIYVRPATAPDTRTAAPSAGPGKAYLQARRAQRDAHEDHYQQARTAADRIAEIARQYAADHVAHPPQSGPLTAASVGENVTNAAFLVADADADAFRRAIQAAAEDLPGILLEMTGPWAPYSFTALLPTPEALAPEALASEAPTSEAPPPEPPPPGPGHEPR
ncbi:GvpL/GvpF family gas vesicle protein [Streptomyces sp. TLI_105]|uniref:GvpL/GvpF family gas vesicle protein n=1 Tax=Streptomyces sp. TLI_105 TaxID=1881019 RepID=UPI00089B39C6|nr:GvpL/GvpF family gas vesicle protein [Streptomyces sp. TLI_105]SEB66723.1 Gas vesicle synthesis protein GvpL/GvpF [Streptomyces sp. TLI_105]